MDERSKRIINNVVSQEIARANTIGNINGPEERLSFLGEKVIDGVVLALVPDNEQMKYQGQILLNEVLSELEVDASFEVRAIGDGLRMCLVSRRVIPR